MTYEEWLKSVELELRRRYKIKDFLANSEELLIIFENDCYYVIDICGLKNYWTTYGFESLCTDINQEIMYQTMKVRESNYGVYSTDEF